MLKRNPNSPDKISNKRIPMSIIKDPGVTSLTLKSPH